MSLETILVMLALVASGAGFLDYPIVRGQNLVPNWLALSCMFFPFGRARLAALVADKIRAAARKRVGGGAPCIRFRFACVRARYSPSATLRDASNFPIWFATPAANTAR